MPKALRWKPPRLLVGLVATAALLAVGSQLCAAGFVSPLRTTAITAELWPKSAPDVQMPQHVMGLAATLLSLGMTAGAAASMRRVLSPNARRALPVESTSSTARNAETSGAQTMPTPKGASANTKRSPSSEGEPSSPPGLASAQDDPTPIATTPQSVRSVPPTAPLHADQGELQVMREQMERAIARAQQLEAEGEAQTNLLKESERILADANAEKKKALAEADAAVQEAEASKQKIAVEIAESLGAKEQAAAHAEKEMNEAREEMEKAVSRVQVLETEGEAQRRLIEESQQKLAEADALKEKAMSEAEAARQEAEDNKQKIADVAAAQLDEELKEVREQSLARLQALETEGELLKAKLQASEQKITDAEEEKDEAMSAAEVARRDMEAIKQTLVETQQQNETSVTSSDEERDAVRERMEETMQRMEHLEIEDEARKARLREVEQKLQDAERAKEKALSEAELACTELEASKRKIAETEEANAKALSEAAEAQRCAQDSAQKVAESEQALAEAGLADLADLRSEKALALERAEAALRELQESRAALQKSEFLKDEAVAQAGELTGKVVRLQTRAKGLESALTGMTASMSAALKDTDLSGGDVSIYDQALNDAETIREQAEELEQEKDQSIAKAEELSDELDESRQKLKLLDKAEARAQKLSEGLKQIFKKVGANKRRLTPAAGLDRFMSFFTGDSKEAEPDDDEMLQDTIDEIDELNERAKKVLGL